MKSLTFIKASPKRIWSILTDFEKYPEWNPFIKRITGPLEEGAQWEIIIQPPHQKRMTFHPKVLTIKPEEELRWLGNMGVPGLFDGEHYFTLEQKNQSTTQFVQGEHFGGILAPMIGLVAFDDTHKGFELMNDALKKRAEG
jgi:hypothetical protein